MYLTKKNFPQDYTLKLKAFTQTLLENFLNENEREVFIQHQGAHKSHPKKIIIK